jgi:hypothetical protein
MKPKFIICTLILLTVLFNSVVFSQDSNSDECDVFYANSKSKKETKLGSFTTSVSEGFSLYKAYKIPGTKLKLVAGVYYDDDLVRQNTTNLDDAIHLKLLVSSQRKFNSENVKSVSPKSTIVIAETHFLFSEEVYPIDVSLVLKTSTGLIVLYMSCKQKLRSKQ